MLLCEPLKIEDGNMHVWSRTKFSIYDNKMPVSDVYCNNDNI